MMTITIPTWLFVLLVIDAVCLIGWATYKLHKGE